VRIVASGGFDEYSIEAAVREGACIDVFGVGTKMGVAAETPYYDMAYKLVKYDDRPVMKLSTGKATLVDDKQVWRRTVDGYYVEDVIALRHETLATSDTEPLLQCVMQDGQAMLPLSDLEAARRWHAVEMTSLTEPYRRLQGGEAYPVRWSQALTALQQQVETALRQQYQEASVGR
jgi:nicotinate phosphoribosyltransferase